MTALLIGRFQPPHRAHLGLMRAALERHGRLLVLLGSANLARSARNPFSAPERAGLIRRALGEQALRVRLRPLADRFDAARWASDVRAAVRAADIPDPVLVGFEKDASSSYLRWFPDWPLETLPGVPGLSATGVRDALWRRDWAAIAPEVQASTLAWLQAFSAGPLFQRLALEDAAIRAERARHEPGHVWHEHLGLHLADGAVSLQRRAGPIGRGLWSLPPTTGGAGPLLGVFDHPSRSLLGPSVARVYSLEAAPGGSQAIGVGQALARPRRFFEDHAVILARLLSLA